ncbi:hypothetical protein [Acidianus sp. HS-5]|uniref:hypothetical protein n=1 Tax=Acidianus sp. HS-5 TaxID=2886040 RepID=UPI001F2EB615|nr:hypothetical protein [Acidianus sp. HS-5]BDC17407.1 hypothetical protein HS5_02970 [Acidianus sp. HS-5]
MKVAILLAILVVSLSTLSSAYSIEVCYPHQVLMEQEFTIRFSLTTSEINSTNFEYITPGAEIVNVSGMTAYKGFGGYWMVDKVNITNTSELVVSFYGKIVGQLTNDPGIVLYGSTINLEESDNSQNSYYVLTSWSGTLWLNKFKGWYSAISTLPTFTSGYYKAIFKNVNGSVCICSISVNSSTYIVKYDTGIPWDNITYVGVRLDTDTVLPLSFSILAIPKAYYVVYLNSKEYTSGYTNEGYSTISLRLYGPATLNITFPQYHIYKTITISPTSNADIHEDFPTLQVLILSIAIILLVISVIREIKSKKA